MRPDLNPFVPSNSGMNAPISGEPAQSSNVPLSEVDQVIKELFDTISNQDFRSRRRGTLTLETKQILKNAVPEEGKNSSAWLRQLFDRFPEKERGRLCAFLGDEIVQTSYRYERLVEGEMKVPVPIWSEEEKQAWVDQMAKSLVIAASEPFESLKRSNENQYVCSTIAESAEKSSVNLLPAIYEKIFNMTPLRELPTVLYQLNTLGNTNIQSTLGDAFKKHLEKQADPVQFLFELLENNSKNYFQDKDKTHRLEILPGQGNEVWTSQFLNDVQRAELAKLLMPARLLPNYLSANKQGFQLLEALNKTEPALCRDYCSLVLKELTQRGDTAAYKSFLEIFTKAGVNLGPNPTVATTA